MRSVSAENTPSNLRMVNDVLATYELTEIDGVIIFHHPGG